MGDTQKNIIFRADSNSTTLNPAREILTNAGFYLIDFDQTNLIDPFTQKALQDNFNPYKFLKIAKTLLLPWEGVVASRGDRIIPSLLLSGITIVVLHQGYRDPFNNQLNSYLKYIPIRLGSENKIPYKLNESLRS